MKSQKLREEVFSDLLDKTFDFRRAYLKDPANLFNSSLEGNTRRAIDIHEGDKINEKAFKSLINAAVTLNIQK